MTFGDRMKIAREKKGLNQVQLAELVNISSPMINQVERGSRNATAPLISRLADVLDCTTDWLIRGKEDSA